MTEKSLELAKETYSITLEGEAARQMDDLVLARFRVPRPDQSAGVWDNIEQRLAAFRTSV